MTPPTSPADGGVVLGVDLGGTVVKAVLFGPDGTTLATTRRPTGARRGAEAVVETVLDVVAESQAAAEERGTPVRAVGLASCGIVDERAGVAVFSASFGWRDVPLRALVAERAGVPVALGHDVRAGGIAEARLGAGRGHEVFLFVPIGTGVGAAVMVGGRPFGGAHWQAGELGHLIVRPGGESCGCGQRGCVSTIVGGPAVLRHYRELAGTGPDGPTDAAGVAALARKGDPDAVRVWSEAVDVLAESLAVAVTLFDPSAIVLGGGLAGAGELLFAPVRERLAARLVFQVMPEVRPAELAYEAGCLGAALLARDLLDRDLPDPAAGWSG
ncbi:ROK family protein [Kitasatospora putterlickiae]|uniref:ROK family protein n=1 Tax=Kitasatospora putterlickiae TaxID=221725 RepID=A0ABN1Y0K4_9ACTN